LRLPEYQGKQIFKDWGIRVPRGFWIRRNDFERGVVEWAGIPIPGVVKAQNLVGGRGKNGGIRKGTTLEEVKKHVSDLFREGFAGNEVEEILVEECLNIVSEAYLSISIDRRERCYSILSTNKGGMEVESLQPKDIRRIAISPLLGLQSYHTAYSARKLSETGATLADIQLLIEKLYEIFIREKATLVEINPLTILSNGEIVAADSKIILDDNAGAKDRYLFAAGNTEKTDLQKAGETLGVNMVQLDGDIAIISNGAGEGMASIDQVIKAGGKISIWTDLGGGALSAKPDVLEKFINAVMDTKPKVLLFTAFFQIGLCDLFAQAFVDIIKKRKESPRIILRLDGRNAEEAKEIVKGSGMLLFNSSNEACLAAVNEAARP
jgi:succinyl-CoA synthetase beta subunit